MTSAAKLMAYKRSSEKKSGMLGMPLGTATARLRKALLFHLVCRLGDNICFRCQRQIEAVSEISIEHKDAWQRAVDPVATFFDLDNIAFSHISCNIRAASRPWKKRDARDHGLEYKRSHETGAHERKMVAKRNRRHALKVVPMG